MLQTMDQPSYAKVYHTLVMCNIELLRIIVLCFGPNQMTSSVPICLAHLSLMSFNLGLDRVMLIVETVNRDDMQLAR